VKLRRSACAWFIGVTLLACLAGSELPELLTLTDNATNDFTVFLQDGDTSSVTVEVLKQTAQPAIADADRNAAHREFVLGSAPGAGPQKDLHALTSQWRL